MEAMETITNSNKKEKKGINPQKFALWLAIGSIIMMFAGLTSGFIVRKPQGDWISFGIPVAFYISTVLILISSYTMHLAVKAFKAGQQTKHRTMVLLTLLLGVGFTILQVVGFYEILAVQKWQNNISFQFLIAIVLMHALHILGGLVAILVFYFKTFSSKFKQFTSNGIEIAATYWHFVDILWIYLFIFFLIEL